MLTVTRLETPDNVIDKAGRKSPLQTVSPGLSAKHPENSKKPQLGIRRYFIDASGPFLLFLVTLSASDPEHGLCG